MVLDANSLLIGAITGGILSGFIPVIAMWLGSKKEQREVEHFMTFIRHEREARAEGKEGFYWSPKLTEKDAFTVLYRLSQSGVIGYNPKFGFMLKPFPEAS